LAHIERELFSFTAGGILDGLLGTVAVVMAVNEFMRDKHTPTEVSVAVTAGSILLAKVMFDHASDLNNRAAILEGAVVASDMHDYTIPPPSD
jgi:hypothetical protein